LYIPQNKSSRRREEEERERELDEQEPIPHYTVLNEYYKDGSGVVGVCVEDDVGDFFFMLM